MTLQEVINRLTRFSTLKDHSDQIDAMRSLYSTLLDQWVHCSLDDDVSDEFIPIEETILHIMNHLHRSNDQRVIRRSTQTLIKNLQRTVTRDKVHDLLQQIEQAETEVTIKCDLKALLEDVKEELR